MFFNYNILIKSGGRFYLVWRLVHQPRAPVSREDVDKLDIPELCNAVISHIPETAGYAELPYSLYLQAQLMHGIALVFKQQVGFFLKDVEEAANALKPVIAKTPKKPQKRKVVEDELDLSNYEDIFSKAAKKKRGGKPHPYEDFSNIRLVAVARPEDITMQEVEPFTHQSGMYDYEDDFGFLNKEEQRDFAVPALGHSDINFLEPEPGAELKRPSKRVTFSGLSPRRAETPVERARMSGDARSAPSSGGRLTDHHYDDQLQLDLSLQDDNFWEALPTKAPGENQDVDGLQRTPRRGPSKEEEVQMDVDQERSQLSAEPYVFRLEPLGPKDLEAAGRKKPRSRRARPTRDNETALTEEEADNWEADYTSTVHEKVDLAKPLRVPFETLINPRPHMIKGLAEALMPLYDKVLIPVYELPMDPETKFTLDFYKNHARRFPFDLEEAVALALEQPESSSPPPVEIYLIGSLADPNFVPDAVVPQLDNVYEAPDMPWDTEKDFSRRGLNDTDSGFVTVEMTPLGTTSGGRRRTFEEILSECRRKTRPSEVYNISPFEPQGAACRRSVPESPIGSRRAVLPSEERQNYMETFFGPDFPEDQIEQRRADSTIERGEEALALSKYSLLVEPSGPELTARSRPSGKSPSPTPGAKNLLEKIKGSGAAAVVFSTLVPDNTKRAAARSFYSLLELLKHQRVKAAQQNAFGEILVRTVSTE